MGKNAVHSRTRFQETLLDSNTTHPDVIPIYGFFPGEHFRQWLEEQGGSTRGWLERVDFDPAKPGSLVLVPKCLDNNISLDCVVLGLGTQEDASLAWWHYGALPGKLPPGAYSLDASGNLPVDKNRAHLAWILGSYSFATYYKSKRGGTEKLPVLSTEMSESTQHMAAAYFLTRDLINIPASDMGPAQLEVAASELASEFGASMKVVQGDDLLSQNFPQIHAVGRAARPDTDQAPRLLDLSWGDSGKSIVLVGKGVTFDTGGLDIKPATGMRLMKKDMAGAAQVLGLASLIMSMNLDCRLRVLVAAVENSIGGDAFRPGDILTARNGKTTEVDNTDAEGRLILADCLTYACESNPDLVIDCATLTGAQRVAMGTDIAGVFSNRATILSRLQHIGEDLSDPVWSLPLHRPYRKELDSTVADLKNCGASGYAGAITAALYLQEFLVKDPTWIHVDFMGYNSAARPGRPEGGEAMGIRALFAFIREFIESPE
uniref:Cytosol aminopeptidase domain-containing protein n=1 Tax=Compsopogon caeruleus TaxID=31354 RepID=A0A7S1TCD1_9RHOD